MKSGSQCEHYIEIRTCIGLCIKVELGSIFALRMCWFFIVFTVHTRLVCFPTCVHCELDSALTTRARENVEASQNTRMHWGGGGGGGGGCIKDHIFLSCLKPYNFIY